MSNAELLEAEAAEWSRGGSGAGLLQIALRRKSLLALGVVLGLVLGVLYYAQRTPVYRSSAQLVVTKKQPAALPVSPLDWQGSVFEDYLSTHLAIVRSPLIAKRAVEKHQLQELGTLAGVEDPVPAILNALYVSRDSAGGSNNNILNLSFRSKVKEDCPAVLDAIIDSYKEFLERKDQNLSDEIRKLITNAVTVLQKDLARKQAAYDEFRKTAFEKLGEKIPLLVRNKEGINPLQERLGLIAAKQSALRIQRAEITARQAALDKALKEGRHRAALAAMISEWSSKPNSPAGTLRPAPLNADEHLLTLLVQQKTLEQEYGRNHPQVQALQQRIQLTRDFLSRPTAARSQMMGVSAKAGAAAEDLVEVYRQSLKQELEDLATTERYLAELFKTEYEDVKALTNYQKQEEAFVSDLHSTRLFVESLTKRLSEVNLVSSFGAFDAQVIAPADGGLRVEPNAFPVFSMALLGGLLGGLGLVYLAEVSDKSFRTPEEIQRRLGVPVIGHIPYLPQDRQAAEAGVAALDPIVCSWHRPKSAEAEAYRGVRTALYFSTHGEGHKIVQITSPSSGDGKTTLAANLGVSIAQSGKKVLLIDADLRKPRLHKLFGLSNESGLSTVIAEGDELDEAIQPGPLSGLHLLASGPLPPNPAELLTSPRFQTLLDAIRLQTKYYDFVLIDTPPLLHVTDPSVVAPRVDGVLLTLRMSKNSRPQADRAKEILATLGTKVLGVVVNAIGPAGAGYQYEQYAYGEEVPVRA